MENTALVNTLICFSSCLLCLLIILLTLSIRLVPQYARQVVFRMGTLSGVRGPGLILLIPFLEKSVMVDMREQACDINFQAVTRDGLPAIASFVFFYKVNDPAAVVLAPMAEKALTEMVTHECETTVRSFTLKDLWDMAQLNTELENRRRVISKQHGVEITRIEARLVQAVTNQA